MSKTPFEIRLELLKMAKEMLEHDYFTDKEMTLNLWQSKVSQAHEHGLAIPVSPDLPTYPGTDDIIKKAKELNIFISNA